MGSKDVGERALGHPDSELLQLPDDAQVAPARVLPGEAHDELDGLVRERWPPRSPVRVGPAPADEGSMPAHDRLGRDEERRPALSRHETRQAGDERPVRPGEPRSGDLSPENRRLVAQHQDLGVLSGGVPPVDSHQLDDAANKTVEKAERHGTGALRRSSHLVKLAIEFLDPSRCARPAERRSAHKGRRRSAGSPQPRSGPGRAVRRACGRCRGHLSSGHVEQLEYIRLVAGHRVSPFDA